MFTDLEGSTRLLHELGDQYPEMLERHQAILRRAFSEHAGIEVDAAGDGFFAVFKRAGDALAAAAEAQHALAEERWPRGAACRVRMGIHVGEPSLRGSRYVGLDVHRAARIAQAAHGGQILLSAAMKEALATESCPPRVVLQERGIHRLKDLRYAEMLFSASIAGLPEPDVAIRSLSGQASNLSEQPTKFIGRQKELAAIRGLLRDHDVRMVTLTGPGGTGKTRLSVEVAAGLTQDFPGGVYQVLLAGISDPVLVPGAIAQTLGIPEVAGQTITSTLKRALASSRVLLVLDNFEQVTSAADLVADLLASCPGLKVVATSREALRLRFERLFEVPPLQVSDQHGTWDKLGSSEAVRLLADRVRDFMPAFAVTPDNVNALNEICMRVDGLPLAIELAASRLKTLTPAALAARLGDRLGVLRGGARDLPDRHQTLRATIDWSFGLLTPEEQVLFRRAAVFVGGFGIDAAESVLPDAMPASMEILDGIASLVGKSLLRQEEKDGEPRFYMLETIREYALEHLENGPDRDPLRARHRAYFLELAERSAPELMGFKQRQAVGRLLTEADNLRAAMTWALEARDARVISRLLNALLWLWIPQGQLSEGLSWAQRAMEATAGVGPTAERALILDVAGWLHIMAGQYPLALPQCQESLTIFQKVGAPSDIARTKMTFGITSAVLGQEQGPQLITDALESYRGLGDRYGSSMALLALGVGARAGGDEAAARGCYEECLALLRTLGNTYWTTHVLQNLAHLQLHEGNWRSAAALLTETLDLALEFNYPMVIGLYLAAMGGVATVRGNAADGARIFGAVDTQLKSLGATFEPTDQAEFERNVAQAKQILGPAAFEVAWREGTGWTQEQALAATIAQRR